MTNHKGSKRGNDKGKKSAHERFSMKKTDDRKKFRNNSTITKELNFIKLKTKSSSTMETDDINKKKTLRKISPSTKKRNVQLHTNRGVSLDSLSKEKREAMEILNEINMTPSWGRYKNHDGMKEDKATIQEDLLHQSPYSTPHEHSISFAAIKSTKKERNDVDADGKFEFEKDEVLHSSSQQKSSPNTNIDIDHSQNNDNDEEKIPCRHSEKDEDDLYDQYSTSTMNPYIENDNDHRPIKSNSSILSSLHGTEFLDATDDRRESNTEVFHADTISHSEDESTSTPEFQKKCLKEISSEGVVEMDDHEESQLSSYGTSYESISKDKEEDIHHTNSDSYRGSSNSKNSIDETHLNKSRGIYNDDNTHSIDSVDNDDSIVYQERTDESKANNLQSDQSIYSESFDSDKSESMERLTTSTTLMEIGKEAHEEEKYSSIDGDVSTEKESKDDKDWIPDFTAESFFVSAK